MLTSTQIFWTVLGLAWGSLEIILLITTRLRRADMATRELYSEWIIWAVIIGSLLIALLAKNIQVWPLPLSADGKFQAGLIVILTGLVLRFYAVLVLGRYFSTRVSIHQSHRLITIGPYRYIRHPSYSGLIVSFFGVGIAMGDYCSVLALLIPLVLCVFKRISIEEKCLLQHFGKDFSLYCVKTKKLIPGLF